MDHLILVLALMSLIFALLSQYKYLQTRRRIRFDVYVRKLDLEFHRVGGESWVLGRVVKTNKINSLESIRNFEKTKIWNYDFASMVVLEKRND